MRDTVMNNNLQGLLHTTHTHTLDSVATTVRHIAAHRSQVPQEAATIPNKQGCTAAEAHLNKLTQHIKPQASRLPMYGTPNINIDPTTSGNFRHPHRLSYTCTH